MPVRGKKYKCKPHAKIDCHDCFDWLALILKYLQKERDQGRWIKKREKYYRNRD